MKINLIFGNRKSGTTLLTRLVDNEYVFSMPSETHFHNLEKVIDLLKNDNFRHQDINRYFNSNLHSDEICLDKERYNQMIVNGLKDLKSYGDYINIHVRALIECTNYQNKNPVNVFIKTTGAEPNIIFHEFLRIFPDSKIISIRRDPKFIVRAIINDRAKRRINLNFSQKLRYCFEAFRTFKQQEEYLNHKHVYTIDFEELRLSHENIMRDVMDFCEAPFTQDNLATTIYSNKIITATHSQSSEPGELKFSSPKLYEGLYLHDYIIALSTPLIFHIINFYLRIKSMLRTDALD